MAMMSLSRLHYCNFCVSWGMSMEGLLCHLSMDSGLRNCLMCLYVFMVFFWHEGIFLGVRAMVVKDVVRVQEVVKWNPLIGSRLVVGPFALKDLSV